MKKNAITVRKKRKYRRFLLFIMGCNSILFIVVGGIFFLLGQNAGEEKVRGQIQIAVQEEELKFPENQSIGENRYDITSMETGELSRDILLVNKEHALPENYEVMLMTLPDGTNRAAQEAYQPLCDMLEAGRKEGLFFEICSSYRDVERQRELFDEDVEMFVRRGYSYSEAYEEAAKDTMPPGHSEHSTGLAFDIVALDYQMLDEGQELTGENQWLQEHCAEYGFILRYPRGKEDITAISYESWHFRYVGKEVAQYIMEQGITLEEYLEL
uniref:M15 family metallopeptidase n=1 Tax=Acetatifactor sp. TaxID=1872090 RepID=UPI004055A9EC